MCDFVFLFSFSKDMDITECVSDGSSLLAIEETSGYTF